MSGAKKRASSKETGVKKHIQIQHFKKSKRMREGNEKEFIILSSLASFTFFIFMLPAQRARQRSREEE